jgi:hypothetical protein
MKVIHNGSLKTDAEAAKEASEEIIDKTKEQETIPSKNNALIWAIVGLLVTVGIIYLIRYIKKDNGEKN